MATASFEVDTYQYYDWSSRKTGKTNLVLKGAGEDLLRLVRRGRVRRASRQRISRPRTPTRSTIITASSRI